MKNIIMHIDMNSYFASVEQQANPFLRGRSVGVCSYLSERGCIIASSMEAKAKGIKTGCRVFEARELDPGVVLLENEPAKYRSTTEKIFEILRSYTDKVEPYSIDEAFLDMTGYASDFVEAENIAGQIQERVKRAAGEWLNSSVGISWTKFLAKFAGDIAPKKSVLTIGDEPALDRSLSGRPLTDAWGINDKTAERLCFLGINDLKQLKDFDQYILKRKLGLSGFYLWANVNGLEINGVKDGVPASKSIGHSYCLPKKTKDKAYLKKILYKLCEKTGRRLRAREMEAKSINVFFGFITGGGAGKGFIAPERMFATSEIYGQAEKFLDSLHLPAPVRSIAVSVSKLSPYSGQMSLFEDKTAIKSLSLAMDKINDKYGEFTVVHGRMFGTEKQALDRVGFRKI
jgi:DNA polymerase IV